MQSSTMRFQASKDILKLISKDSSKPSLNDTRSTRVRKNKTEKIKRQPGCANPSIAFY